MTAYLDSNIFIYAFTDELKYGRSARELLKRIKEGNETAVTSAMTFNEGMHIMRKLTSFEESLSFGENLLEMPNLRIEEIDKNILFSALNLIKKYKLSPADAIHIATAIQTKVETVYSEDEEFKRVKEIKLKAL